MGRGSRPLDTQVSYAHLSVQESERRREVPVPFQGVRIRHHGLMAVGREQRMVEVTPRLKTEFGADLVPRVIQVLTLGELAWHDCYGEPSPPGEVLDDILVVADGSLERLIEAVLLAVEDYRDLRLLADARRGPDKDA